jgi:hypothetical protein
MVAGVRDIATGEDEVIHPLTHIPRQVRTCAATVERRHVRTVRTMWQATVPAAAADGDDEEVWSCRHCRLGRRLQTLQVLVFKPNRLCRLPQLSPHEACRCLQEPANASSLAGQPAPTCIPRPGAGSNAAGHSSPYRKQ